MSQSLPTTDVIDAAELRRLMAEDPNVRILDVRTGAEFETVHIPGSYNVPLDTLAEHVSDLADTSHPVVLVCQSGGRAGKAHGHLSGAGREALHILEGGMNGWQAAGGETVRGTVERWAMDRQVRLVAGAMALVAILASTVFAPAKWLAGAVAGGLFYSAVSDTCAMATVLSKLPYNRTDRCDIAGVIAALDQQEPNPDSVVDSTSNKELSA